MNQSGRVNAAFIGYLQLIDIPAQLFYCCEKPKMLCMDGIVLSVESRRIHEQNLKRCWATQIAGSRATTRDQRAIWSFNEEHKKLLKAYANGESTSEGIYQISHPLVDLCKTLEVDDNYSDCHPFL